MRDLPSGTVTLLFTDIEGSTRLLHELGDAFADLLAEHRRVLREAFGRHGGVEVDTQGDAFFYAFARAGDAAAAADEAQRALTNGSVRVRMGVHTGEPRVTDEGYVGADVHRAARIMSAGHGGQVLVSEATRKLVDATFELRDLGEHRLKDLDAPERIFQLGDRAFPPLKSLNNTNLPLQLEPLLGRKRELADLLRLIRYERVRLVTLIGPGGIGKTRLALELASELVGDFTHGVWLVDLSPVRDGALVEAAAASALGARIELAEHIADRDMLLVLDNFEQVVDSAPSVGRLLSTCANVVVLVTSREALNVAGERAYPVPPLAEAPAVELFRQRASAAVPDFDASYGDLVDVCTRLDSLPLAIELAAARAKTLPPDELRARLERRLPLLSKGRRDAPERQRTLRATIDWSYQLLDPGEQRAFARLAVFAGGWTLAAAEAVCGVDIDMLDLLVEKSLVQHRGGRYSMLETIREYAAELLHESEEAETLSQRHGKYFLEVAERANRDLMYGEGSRASWTALRADEQNFRAAMYSRYARSDVEFQLRLAHAIRSPWSAAGHAGECRRWIEDALRRGGETIPPLVRARALANIGWLARRQRDASAARAFHERSLELYREADDLEGVARSLVGLGGAAVLEGRLADARRLFEQAAAIARTAGSRPVVGGALEGMAAVAVRQGEVGRLRELADEAAADGDDGFVWSLQGRLALLRGDAETAARLFRASLRDAYEVGFRIGLPGGLASLAEAIAGCGDARAAAVLLASSAAAEQAFGVGADPWDDARREELAEVVRRTLGDDVYALAQAEGARLGPDEAVAFALATVD